MLNARNTGFTTSLHVTYSTMVYSTMLDNEITYNTRHHTIQFSSIPYTSFTPLTDLTDFFSQIIAALHSAGLETYQFYSLQRGTVLHLFQHYSISYIHID